MNGQTAPTRRDLQKVDAGHYTLSYAGHAWTIVKDEGYGFGRSWMAFREPRDGVGCSAPSLGDLLRRIPKEANR